MGMKHSTKLLLWIVGGFAGLFVVAIVAAAMWVSRGGGSGVMQRAMDADADGKRLGALVDARACVDTAFAHHARGEGRSILGSAAQRIFLENCLNASRPTPGLCDTVPPVREILREATWATRVCRDRRFDDMYCPGLLQELADYCGRKRVT
jgi:hypothetical protein